MFRILDPSLWHAPSQVCDCEEGILWEMGEMRRANTRVKTSTPCHQHLPLCRLHDPFTDKNRFLVACARFSTPHCWSRVVLLPIHGSVYRLVDWSANLFYQFYDIFGILSRCFFGPSYLDVQIIKWCIWTNFPPSRLPKSRASGQGGDKID